jgi:hypothetical protein
MANYCSNEDVSVLLRVDAFTATSRPTATQVQAVIEDVTNEIDFVLAGIGIATQPTDTKILGRLTIACKTGVAAQIEVDKDKKAAYETKYQAILKEITNKPEMYGSITGNETAYMSNNVTDGTNTEAEIAEKFIDDYRY